MGTIAHAERRPVAVVDLSEPSLSPGEPSATQLKAVATEIRERLLNHEELSRILDPDLEKTLLGNLLQDEDKPSLDKARAAKERAENALAEFKFADAGAAAVDGMDTLQNVDPPAAVALYADLEFILGQARLGEKKLDLASRAFALVHRLQDRRRVDPSRYLPEVVAAYDKAQPAPATLSIEVRGTGRVWIDGVAVGDDSGTYPVGPGDHIVQLAGPDRSPRGLRITAPRKDPVAIDDAPAEAQLKIQRARFALAHATDPAERATVMVRLAELTKVKDAVLLWVVNGKISFQPWRDGAPGYNAPVFLAREAFDPNKGVGQMLDRLAPPKKPPKPPDKPIVIPPEPTPWYRKAWLTGTVIGSLIAIVGGAVVWSERGPGHAGVTPGISFDQTTSSRPR